MDRGWWLRRGIERIADRRILSAMEAGEFSNLEGSGRPLAILDEPYEPDWWIRRWSERERHVEQLRKGRRELAAAGRRGPSAISQG